MIPLTLAEISDAVGGSLHDVSDRLVQPSGVVRIDSRDVEPGDVFACVRGGDLDGHDFVAEAVARGAVLCLASRPVDAPHVLVADVVAALGALARAVVDRRPRVAVVGITGSSGKTSTKDLLAQVLESVAPTVSPPGSFNNELGLPLTVLRTADDTRFLVLELGARGVGHIRALTEVAPPHIGVVLNVGSAHLGEFGDRAAVAAAKGELVEALVADDVAVLNADDPAVVAMRSRTKARVVTFGLAPAADVRAIGVRVDAGGRASFALTTDTGAAQVRLQLVGAHHVSNALAAAAAAVALGVDLDVVADALSAAGPRSSWRMEVTTTDDGVTVVNDAYNANPESVRAALESLAAIGAGRRTWAVLGEMRELGAESVAAHRAIGELAVRLGVARIVAVGAAAAPVLDGARSAGAAGDALTLAPDVPAAIDVVGEAHAGDVVLVKASRAVGLEAVADALLARGVATGAVEATAGEDAVLEDEGGAR